MHAAVRAPGRAWAAAVSWQARRIADPLERLKFLRRTVGDRRLWDFRMPAGKEWARRRRGALAAALIGAILLPAGAVKEKAGRWARPPVLTAQASERVERPAPAVWPVEEKPDYEEYSNGLRIERKYETANQPRRYEVYTRGAEEQGPKGEMSAPAGIVFHTTESAQPEFREGETRRIKLAGAYLLEYVQREKAYHYVVDRFGRVWRVVRESDAANHAGYSVWAGERWTYINLNWSFLGISVEAVTQPGDLRAEATGAQIHALRVLTEMLRAKYRIAAANCVTHAQVSVNPANMQAGYHYDWAANFPYTQIGLPDNYALPAHSLWLFGFSYDPSLVNMTGEPFWKGLLLGEEQLRQNATAHGMSVAAYRNRLEARYRQILSRLKTKMETSKEKHG